MTTFVQAADSNYLPAGLALYRSLLRHQTGDWRMVWVVLDEAGLDALRRWTARHPEDARRLWCVDWRDVAAEVPGLSDALLDRLDATGRRTSEWYWTWASQVTHWMIERNPGETTVFLDTDCYAFADLSPALAEVADTQADVGLVSHRFPPHRAHMAARAHFNVGTLTTFRPTIRARACAAWWAAMVRARCEATDPGDGLLEIPSGRAGDQAPLDAFPRLAYVEEIMDPGTGLAPYNWDAHAYGDHQEYGLCMEVGARIERNHGLNLRPVRLAHFHESRFDPATGAVVKRTGYPIPDDVERYLLAPYEADVAAAAAELR